MLLVLGSYNFLYMIIVEKCIQLDLDFLRNLYVGRRQIDYDYKYFKIGIIMLVIEIKYFLFEVEFRVNCWFFFSDNNV